MKAEDILLISIGGGAANIVKRISAFSDVTLRTLVLDTDDAVISEFPPERGISSTVFGAKRLGGRGTGGDRLLAISAFRDDASAILAQIGTPRLALILTCVGGGTSGATQVLLDALHGLGITTMTFATEPFSFEGNDRDRNRVVSHAIGPCTDAITRIPLDSLLEDKERALPCDAMFDCVARKMALGLHLFWTLLSRPAYFSFDVEHFLFLYSEEPCVGERAFSFATATATGETRAQTALTQLMASPAFMKKEVCVLSRAATVVVGIIAGEDLRLAEISTVMGGVREVCTSAKSVLLGTAKATQETGELTLVVMAFFPSGISGTNMLGDELPKGNRKATRAKKSIPMHHNRFSDVEPTIINGVNLDEPTYNRRGIRLKR